MSIELNSATNDGGLPRCRLARNGDGSGLAWAGVIYAVLVATASTFVALVGGASVTGALVTYLAVSCAVYCVFVGCAFVADRGPKIWRAQGPASMPTVCEVQVANDTAKHRSDGQVMWTQFGVDARGSARVFVVGSHASDGPMKSLARDFSFRGLGVDFCNDFEETLNSLSVSPQRWSLLVVDVDYVERSLDVENIVNELVLFREQFSNIAIVLLSHSFATDDSGLDRSAIADHSFRASVGAEAIYAALPQIFANNRSWVLRREALRERDQVIVSFPRSKEQ